MRDAVREATRKARTPNPRIRESQKGRDRALAVLAVGYPSFLIGIVLALRFIGEKWWATTIALYLPRWPLALLVPVLSVALLRRGRYELLATQLVALLVWLFPLAGLQLNTARATPPGRVSVRVLTMNVHSSPLASALASELRASQADVILLQEALGWSATALKRDFPLHEWRADGEFVIGSRYPIAETTLPLPSTYGADDKTRRYVRYRLIVPSGQLNVYNVHAPSPSRVFGKLGHDLESGSSNKWGADVRFDIQTNATQRMALLEAVDAAAHTSESPLIIAGDTNLPGLSLVLANVFNGFHDAFLDVGAGFGYTFPVGMTGPWMRIDRVYGNRAIRFVKSRVTSPLGSDHLGLVVDFDISNGSSLTSATSTGPRRE